MAVTTSRRQARHRSRATHHRRRSRERTTAPARGSGPLAAFPTGGQVPGGDPYGSGSAAAPYATWGIRLGGYLIDTVIFVVVLIVLLVVFRHSNTLEVHLMARRGTTARRRHISALPFIITARSTSSTAPCCAGRRGARPWA